MKLDQLTPLTFTPIVKERIWGGHRLATVLGKPLPGNQPIGESWELADLADEQSIVDAGPLKGQSLRALTLKWGTQLLGPVLLEGGSFPALVKYIDADQILSVQVHPDRMAAKKLGGRAKTEAWYILEAIPGTMIYRGLQPGTRRETFAALLTRGRVEEQLVAQPVHPGDLIPLPAGIVHAIGAGILLAEVQQPSDTTYRISDWGRLGRDGRPRQLHLAEALESTHFGETPPLPSPAGNVDLGVFHLKVQSLGMGEAIPLHGEGPLVIIGLEGHGLIQTTTCDPIACPRGKVVLLPHCCRGAQLQATPFAKVLLVSFPPGDTARRSRSQNEPFDEKP